MILPMLVPSRWRARQADQSVATGELTGTTAEPELTEQPTTQFTPVAVTTLAPIPAPPWHDLSDRGDPANP
jgi:hypothetical protein